MSLHLNPPFGPPLGLIQLPNSPKIIPENVKIQVEKQNILKISGSDKQKVGMVAAEIKSLRPPEPYKVKGIKEQGQYILRKEGKKK